MKFLPKTVDTQFLIRVIRDEVSPEEMEFFEKWIDESDDNKEEFSSISLLWDKFQYSHLPSLPDQDEQWEEIQSAIDIKIPAAAQLSAGSYLIPVIEENKGFDFSTAVSWVYKFAAVIILCAALYLLGDSIRYTSVQKNSAIEKTEPDIKYFTSSTGKGEHATFTLADGSVIQLNSQSKLTYPNYFKWDSREIDFEGEAYFKIARDKKRPFRVRCGNVLTEVTGTEFNIKDRENKFSIAVVEGSVKTFNNKVPGGVAVKKGEMIFLKSSGNFTRPVKVPLDNFLAWRENKISFSGTPLSEAAVELERNYNNLRVFVVSDSIKTKRITGVFNTKSLDEILSIFKLTLDIKVSRKGDKIYFE